MNAVTNMTGFDQALAQFNGQVSKVAQQIQMVLPSHITVEKFQRVLMAAVKADPELLRADRRSLLNACEKCAIDGLIPDKREAALVVFKRNYKDAQGAWQQALEVTYMPMVYGLRKKILQSGEVADITCKVVYRAEVEQGAFIYEEGTERMLRHRPLLEMTPEQTTDDQIVAAYSMATYKDGSKSYEVMRRFEIDEVRECSQTGATKDRYGKPRKPSGPWVDWFGEQAKKTVMRRHSKSLPMSSDIVDVEGADLDITARSTARMLEVEPDAPVSIPNRDDPAMLADRSGTEAGVQIEANQGEPSRSDWSQDSRGMTEVDEETARQLDAGTAYDPDTGEVLTQDPEQDRPAWWSKVEWIRDMANKAKNKQHLKDADDEFLRIRVGLPDDVIEELDALIARRRSELTKPRAEA